MATTGDNPYQEIEVFVGYDEQHGYHAQGAGGGPAAVSLIGGSRGTENNPTAIQWTIENRCGHPVNVRLHNFQPDPENRCPVAGGDLPNCEFEHQGLSPNGTLVVDTFINVAAEPGRYTYDLEVISAESGKRNPIDPELQIDN